MICPHCQRPFEPGRPHQVFCGPKCRVAHHKATLGDGGLRAPVRTVKVLSSGQVSVTLRFPPQEAKNAFSLRPGMVIEVVSQ
jgi:hypothetical protein